LIERNLHPEWLPFLILAAIRRAEELKRLLDLPGSPGLAALPPQAAESQPAPPKVSGLPAGRKDTDPDRDETGSIAPQPVTGLPVEIGETSSAELPLGASEEKPPVIRTPERAKPRQDSRVKRPPVRRAKTPARPKQVTSDFFGDFFGTKSARPAAPANADVR
jgi:hypothetical protein